MSDFDRLIKEINPSFAKDGLHNIYKNYIEKNIKNNNDDDFDRLIEKINPSFVKSGMHNIYRKLFEKGIKK